MLRASDLINEMSSDLGLLPGQLRNIIRTAPIRYKVFYIPKRSGGFREVAQPAREIKAIQRWLINRLTPLLPLHDAATAYRPGASIKQNALQHVESNYMLKMDFRNFFPSILISDVIQHLQRHCGHQFDISAIKLVAYVCTWAPNRQGPLRLCIGAPSSPLLSNSIMFDFDLCLSSKAKEDDVGYTRYADDLALSTKSPGVLDIYPTLVRDIANNLDYPKLVVNENKTVFASRAGRRVVTGVTLATDHKVSIGRERKRAIRAMYHRMTLGQLDADGKQELEGLLAFAEDIEPGFRAWLTKMSK